MGTNALKKDPMKQNATASQPDAPQTTASKLTAPQSNAMQSKASKPNASQTTALLSNMPHSYAPQTCGALHRCFFPLALLGGILLCLLPMLAAAPGHTVLAGVTALPAAGLSAAEPLTPKAPDAYITLNGLAARAAAASDRLIGGGITLLLHALAGTLAVRIAPVGKRLLFVCGLLPFALQMACQSAPESLLFPLALLFSAQALALAFLPVRAKAGRWAGLALTAAALAAPAITHKPAVLAVLLCAGLIPLRRWIPLALLSPVVLPGPEGQRRAARRTALGRVLGVGLRLLWFAAALWLLLTLFPLPMLRSLRQSDPAALLPLLFTRLTALLRLLCAGLYPDAAAGELFFDTIFGSLAGVRLFCGALPLAWGVLLCGSVIPPAGSFLPGRRQRIPVLCIGAAGILGALGVYLVWDVLLIGAALTVLCFLPAVLWALTPTRLLLRRERPGLCAATAACLLVLTAAPGILSFF